MNEARCLCGAVTFTVTGTLPPAAICHCRECRRQSSHQFAATTVRKDDLTIRGGENLSWYHASSHARRGFCKRCGAWLFWEPLAEATVDVAMGAFDTPTGTEVARHIFVAEKGDYYRIADGLPQEP
ncbi:MAG: GFA family protein [Sphingomonadaceae bacterium]|nr:GFA family protein [Sphingomonadaceae bacterium]